MICKNVKWTGPKSACFDLNSKITMFIFPGTSSPNGFFPKHCNQKGAWRHIQIQRQMRIHIQIHIPYMGLGRAAGSGWADGRAGAHMRDMYSYI